MLEVAETTVTELQRTRNGATFQQLFQKCNTTIRRLDLAIMMHLRERIRAWNTLAVLRHYY